MDGDQNLELYWIDPVDAMDRLVARPEFKDKIYFKYERQESEQRPTKRAFGRANSGTVFQEAQALDLNSVPMLHLFYADKSFSGAHGSKYPVYACVLNLHESERRKPKNWIPIAWLPIYDEEKGKKRPSQGYESHAARNMRLYHDCWRHILGRWKEKTQHARKVVYAGEVCHQTRSIVGGLLGDQQVCCIAFMHNMHIMHNTHNMHIIHKMYNTRIMHNTFFVSGEGSNDRRGLSRMPPLLRLTGRIPVRNEKKYQNYGCSAHENNESCFWD